MRWIITTAVCAGLLAGVASTPGFAQDSFDEAQTGDIETIVRNYLIENPEVLVEAMNALQERQEAEARTAQASAIETSREQLVSAPEGMVLGNPDGDVTITEFFDYNCGYCKQALTDMTTLIEEDDDVRFVLKEFPILGTGSLEAARVAMALRDLAPDQYRGFHEAMMSTRGGADKAAALRIAEGLGVDPAAIEEKLAASANMEALQEIQMLASELRVNGTPTYVIGDEVIQARVGLEGLRNAVSEMRECGRIDCG